MSSFDQEKFDKYISEKIVIPLIDKIVDNKQDIYRNTLDPFSALVDCMIRNCTPTNWKTQEEARQTQKTLQNKVGTLHEYVIDCFDDWEKLDVGKVVDIINKKRMVIAEIKNKHNTTKGNHKKDIYDDLAIELGKNYKGYTAYYVEILPKNRARYHHPFTPPDNTKNGQKKPSRKDIRIIDGYSFYDFVSGENNFIKNLYTNLLPKSLKKAIDKINKNRINKLSYPKNISSDPLFKEFFDKAF